MDADTTTRDDVHDTGESRDPRPDLQRVYGRLAGTAAPGARCCFAGGGPASPSEGQASPLSGPLPGDPGPPGWGCGDPLAFANVRPGETVLDLGCGEGGDCMRAAVLVGEKGRVLGVDMTPEMLAVARSRRDQLALHNVEFRLGEIEHLPVSSRSVDVVISNCVINLSADRERVFREAFRVLRPGGRLSVCDVLVDGPIPASVRAGLGEAARGLVEEGAYLDAIRAAGFTGIHIERSYPGPAPADGSGMAPLPEAGGRAVTVVRVAETGEERTLQLEKGVVMGRSFSGSISAVRPGGAGPGSGLPGEGGAG